ncbi:MAG: DUF1846 domain-containing protein [Kiritimatiellia bacterium]
MREIGFDSEKYLEEQSRYILERASQLEGRLYLEFGGKLVFDMHAARCLPGFDPNVKIKLLEKMKDDTEIIICIHSDAIVRKKMRADFGITYDFDILRLIDDLRKRELMVSGVVVTRFNEEPPSVQFMERLKRRGVKVYAHRNVEGYPNDVDRIVCKEGFGVNEHIETSRPVVVVTAPGPGSGKMATCLNQLYHEHVQGRTSGYAKFETFPIWNIPLDHPVNIAYEAATADLADYNVIDPFHLEAHGESAVNYNRDVESFPILKRIIERVTGAESMYASPTDMGVNRAGFAIVDDDVVRRASLREIARRVYSYRCEYAQGLVDKSTVECAEKIVNRLGLDPDTVHTVVKPARQAFEKALEKASDEIIVCAAAIELPGGTVVTGKSSQLMHASSCLILNAVKRLADIPQELDLLEPAVIESISDMKQTILKGCKQPTLDLEEMLIALSVSAATSSLARLGVAKLAQLRGCDVHLTHIPTPGDRAGMRQLGIQLTSDPKFAGRNLFEG